MVNIPSLLLFFLLCLLSLSSPFNFDSFGIKNPPPLSKIVCAEIDTTGGRTGMGRIYSDDNQQESLGGDIHCRYAKRQLSLEFSVLRHRTLSRTAKLIPKNQGIFRSSFPKWRTAALNCHDVAGALARDGPRTPCSRIA
jgi:hypothetical protein